MGMPGVTKQATKSNRTRQPSTLTPEERAVVQAMPSAYREMFGAHRAVGQPPIVSRGYLRPLSSNGNPADKVLAERRALAVLKARHYEELEQLYYEELAYVEAGGE